uniref:Uncharacterized protein n=1 Tax=Romanomermis culicivorax TaxID=13658 RepID=A0A915KZG6_ROMCU
MTLSINFDGLNGKKAVFPTDEQRRSSVGQTTERKIPLNRNRRERKISIPSLKKNFPLCIARRYLNSDGKFLMVSFEEKYLEIRKTK